MSLGTLWERKCSFETHFVYWIIFRQGANIFGPRAKSSLMVVKSAFDVSIGTLWGKPFSYSTKRICVCLARTINETSSGSWQNSFSFWLCFFNRFVKTAFYLSWRQLRGAFFVSEKKIMFSDFFRHWLKTVRAFVKIFRMGLPRLLATSPEETFRDKCIFWKTLFSFESSPTLGEKVSPI